MYPGRLCLAAAIIAAGLPAWGQQWKSGVAKVIPHSQYSVVPGTAFVVSVQGNTAYLITLAHVLAGDPKPDIEFAIDTQTYEATIFRKDSDDKKAMAILKVKDPPKGLKVLNRIEQLPAGADVKVIGYPTDLSGDYFPMSGTATVRGLDLIIRPSTGSGYSGGPVLFNESVAGMVYGHIKDYGSALLAETIAIYLRNNGIIWGGEAPAPPPVAPRARRTGDKMTNAVDGLTYIWIEPGTFKMGCSGESECYDFEKPAGDVTITRGLWLGQTEVTQEAWRKVMGSDPSKFKGAQLPVESITWDEARDYCAKIGGRLPTEAEWEFAARAGSTSSRYGDIDVIAWYANNSGRATLDSAALLALKDGSKYRAELEKNGNQTRPVAGKRSNAWGLYDMLGNVGEWVADWHDAEYYAKRETRDPKGPSDGKYRILRGGSWNNNPRNLRVSVRGRLGPTNRYNNIGVRCAGEFR